MKANRDHRVPLSCRATELLRTASTLRNDSALLFPSPRGKPLSDMTLSKLLKEQGVQAVPHGFRSSFRDWAAEETNHPREAVEAALAHQVKDKVEAAYARSTLFERRRQLMTDWGAYLTRHRRQLDRGAAGYAWRGWTRSTSPLTCRPPRPSLRRRPRAPGCPCRAGPRRSPGRPSHCRAAASSCPPTPPGQTLSTDMTLCRPINDQGVQALSHGLRSSSATRRPKTGTIRGSSPRPNFGHASRPPTGPCSTTRPPLRP